MKLVQITTKSFVASSDSTLTFYYFIKILPLEDRRKTVREELDKHEKKLEELDKKYRYCKDQDKSDYARSMPIKFL